MNTGPAAPGQAGQAVVTMPAEIDIANTSRLQAALLAAFRPDVTLVIADLSETTFCDSSGVRMLVTATRHAAAHDQRLRVVTSAPAVLRIFELTGLDQVTPVYSSLEAALAPAPEPVTGAS